MGNRLEEIIKEQGRMKTWVAEKAKVDRNTLNHLINGQDPKLSQARRISRVLQVPIDTIWPDNDPE